MDRNSVRIVTRKKSSGLSFETKPPSRTTVAQTTPTVATLLVALVRNISKNTNMVIFHSGLCSSCALCLMPIALCAAATSSVSSAQQQMQTIVLLHTASCVG